MRIRLTGYSGYLVAKIRGFAAFVAAGVLVVTCTARVVGATTADNSHVRAVVLFVGDSNVSLGAGPIDWVLTSQDHNDNGYIPVMASRFGAGIRTPDCLETTTPCPTADYWATKIGEILAKVRPDAIVSDLGINDAVSTGTLTSLGYGSYTKKIDWFMSVVPSTTPVLWTNLPCGLEPVDRFNGCNAVNYALKASSSRWSNLAVMDWNFRAYGHPEYMSAPGTEVHLSTTGHLAWANLVVQRLDARFPAP